MFDVFSHILRQSRFITRCQIHDTQTERRLQAGLPSRDSTEGEGPRSLRMICRGSLGSGAMASSWSISSWKGEGGGDGGRGGGQGEGRGEEKRYKN